ncbi:MAG TPA: Shedu anti-phage system protein SduA domain-containing protein, partial [Patescibacteria group bacterium]
ELFFNDNPWIFQQIFAFPVIYLNGETYLGGKNSKGRQGSGGSATDFLFKNGSNGSFAVVEVKTPGCSLVSGVYRGVKDSGNRNEIYEIHGDLSGGLVQLENQIYVAIEYFKTQIGADYRGLNHLNPTGVLLAGNCAGLTQNQKRSFNLFRKSLGKNQIYTFDEVLAKLKLLKDVYEI